MKKWINKRTMSPKALAAAALLAAPAAALATPPAIPALDPFIDLDSVGTAITGGLTSMFTLIIPIVLVSSLIVGLVVKGAMLLRGRRGIG